jgi:Transposase/Transposase IS116/IS110/IS902 family
MNTGSHAKKVVRIVLESGQLSTWLTRELRALDLPVVCVDARQAHRSLSGRLNKSDSTDAKGLAQLGRTGWFREVHIKSLTSDRLRALLSARDRLIRIRKELEGQVRGTLKTFGIKLGSFGRGREREGFRHQVRTVSGGDPVLKAALAALLATHQAVCREFELLEVLLRRAAARTHELIGRMMTVPGIGPITAAAFIAVIDSPDRFRNGQRCRLPRPDPTSLPIRGSRLLGTDLKMRRLDAARLSLRGGVRRSRASQPLLIAQELGHAPSRAQGLAKGRGRRRAQARHDPLPNLDRRDDVPLGPGGQAGCDLTAKIVTFRFPLGNGWNSGTAGTAVG